MLDLGQKSRIFDLQAGTQDMGFSGLKPDLLMRAQPDVFGGVLMSVAITVKRVKLDQKRFNL